MRLFSSASNLLQTEIDEFRKAIRTGPGPSSYWDLWGLHNACIRASRYLLEQHHSPAKVGWAIFWGVLVGTSPFFGLHFFMSMGVALILRLNKVIVYAAANISNPVLAPLLILASYQIGFFLFNGTFAPLNITTIKESGVGSFRYWLIGSLILGGILGSALGLLTYLMMKRAEFNLDPFNLAVKKLYRSFLVNGHFAAGVAKGKCKWDPLYRRLTKTIPSTKSILDLGGGQGYLCFLHNFSNQMVGAKYVVWDWDPAKLEQGIRAASTSGIENIEFRRVDIFSQETFPRTDVVCLIDVLHYQPIFRQNQLLRNLSKNLPSGTTLFIRDIDADHRWRTRFTLMQEKLSLSFGFTKARHLHPRSGKQLANYLTKLGFEVDIEPCWQGTPFANVLVMARKMPDWEESTDGIEKDFP